MTGSGKSVIGAKYVLLATDGGPNGNTVPCEKASCTANIDRNELSDPSINYCDPMYEGARQCLDSAATVDQLSAMAAQGIKTFVVGVPGTLPYKNTLDAMAVAGGVPASASSPALLRGRGRRPGRCPPTNIRVDRPASHP